MQLGWPLPLIFDTHSKRALEVPSRFGNGLGDLVNGTKLPSGGVHPTEWTGEVMTYQAIATGISSELIPFSEAGVLSFSHSTLHTGDVCSKRRPFVV